MDFLKMGLLLLAWNRCFACNLKRHISDVGTSAAQVGLLQPLARSYPSMTTFGGREAAPLGVHGRADKDAMSGFQARRFQSFRSRRALASLSAANFCTADNYL